jgi:O-antigen/teichoic acid export membrane protein
VGRIQWLLLGLICTGYIFFGKIFIEFWVGQGYESAYYVGLLLIIPGSIDLIQNLGIEIQRAKNLHGFRAAIYLIMAIINVIVSIFLCQKYGAIGAAIGTAISLVVVQGIIINIYLFKKCGINVLSFWGSIIRLSLGLVPPVVVGLIIIRFININSILVLIACVALYTMVYCGSMWLIGMNNYEKDLVKKPLFKILKRKGNK